MKETSLRRVLGTALAVVIVAAAAATVWAAAKSSVNPKNQGRSDAAIDQAVKAMNGTWKLVKRMNPDGSEHPHVDGITTIDLTSINSKQLGARALGMGQAREHGESLDHRFGPCVPPESADKPFYIESAGAWDVTVKSEDADSAVLIVKQNHVVVKGNFRPYLEGLAVDAESTYRLYKEKPGQSARLELATPLKFKNGLNMKGEALAAVNSLDQSCCDTSTMSVSGDNMKINWSNGAQDFWVRVSQTVSPEAYKN